MNSRIGGTEDIMNVAGDESPIPCGFMETRVCSVNRFDCASIADVDLGRGSPNYRAYYKTDVSKLLQNLVFRRRSIFLACTVTHHIFHEVGVRRWVPSR